MGVDISGRKPKTEIGDYFKSNWWEAGTGRMVNGEECDSLNQQFNYGIIHYTPIVSQSGKMVESSHSVSVYRIKEFITFLRECGGFQIW